MPAFDAVQLTPKQRIDWLRLARTNNIGPLTFYRIMEKFNGDAARALEALPDLAKRGGKRQFTAYSQSRAEDELAVLHKHNGRLIAACEPEYPQSLKMIEDAPPVLSILGNADLLNQPSIAIVGARNASINGKKMAAKMAGDIGAADYIITSGLARGIDTAAHEGALQTGTVAVLAGGVDNIYPSENRELYKDILQQGAIISENAWGTVPKAQHFPRRNRIVSGLSLGTVVIEAATKSGSLITARLAAEQGREVFAVPGNPLDPRAGGPNQLIKRNQAQLITGASDVLNTVKDMTPRMITPVKRPLLWEDETPFTHDIPESSDDNSNDNIISFLSPNPTDIDDIAQETKRPIHEILTILLELEIAGRLQRHAGNRVSLIDAA